jgi:hypothetical protein
VDTLPTWEQEILLSVDFLDKCHLLEALRTAEQLYLASDGGAADRCGSFGAVMVTDEDILVECGGRAHGADPRSFRAEGYGILAILRLAFHLRYFYVTRNRQLKFRLYCDSESLLKRITASQALQRQIPRRFLHSEVDVEMQTLAAIDALTNRIDLEHVKGHQDTKYPDHNLYHGPPNLTNNVAMRLRRLTA